MKRTILLATAIAALAIGCASAVPSLESYRGHMIVVGTVGTAANQNIQLSISRWTTEAERNALFTTLRDDGPSAFRSALIKSEETGFLSIAGRTTYRMRYAYATEGSGGRQIVLATDRDLAFSEVSSPTSLTRSYDITVVVLNIDENGTGNGIISVGTEVSYDATRNTLVLENYSTEPVRLNNISRID